MPSANLMYTIPIRCVIAAPIIHTIATYLPSNSASNPAATIGMETTYWTTLHQAYTQNRRWRPMYIANDLTSGIIQQLSSSGEGPLLSGS
jgi:hypothetical protein